MSSSAILALRACAVALVGAVAAGQISIWLVDLIPSSSDWVGVLREPTNLGLVVLVGFVFARAFGRPSLIRVGHLGPALWQAALIGLGPVSAAWALLYGLQLVQIGEPDFGPMSSAAALAILPLLMCHGLAEQWLVRRLAQDKVEAWLGPWAGIVAAAAVWAAIQALQGYREPMLVVNSFLFAALLGFVARSRGGVLAAGLAHGLWTWFETQLLPQTTTSTLAIGWLAGGGSDTYGAGAFTLVLLAILAGAAWRWPPGAKPAALSPSADGTPG